MILYFQTLQRQAADCFQIDIWSLSGNVKCVFVTILGMPRAREKEGGRERIVNAVKSK